MNYIKHKLSTKLNLHLSGGKKTSGVLSDNVMNKLLSNIDGCGRYEIIWDAKNLLPIGMMKLSDEINIKVDGNITLTYRNGVLSRLLFPTQFISFDISEYRNRKLKEILN